jgi:hypothetical protein
VLAGDVPGHRRQALEGVALVLETALGIDRYPVTAIVNIAWQHTGLGDVTASGQSLMAATSGYSLLRIAYTTTSLDWRVALPIDEEVQFVLVDA